MSRDGAPLIHHANVECPCVLRVCVLLQVNVLLHTRVCACIVLFGRVTRCDFMSRGMALSHILAVDWDYIATEIIVDLLV